MTSAGPNDAREPDAGRLPSARPALAVAVVLLLLAVVASASGGGNPFTAGDRVRDVPNLVVDYSYTLAIVVAVAIALGALAILAQAGKAPAKPGARPGRSLIALVFFLLLAIGLSRVIRERQPPAPEDVQPIAGEVEPVRPTTVERQQRRSPEFRWELAVIAAAAGAAGLAYALRRLRPDEPEADPGQAAEAVSLVLDEALDDLRAERDARRAVIAAYARLERTLARHGLPRRPSEAPLEYLSRILLELEVAPEAVLDLTDLFEQAKFSQRQIDAAMKDEAIEALVAVRDDLRVAA